MARHGSELVAWQLADDIRGVVMALTKLPPFAGDVKFRGRVEDAADAVCRNIVAGFGCESHLEFARFLEIARCSLNELLDALHSAASKQFVTIDDTRPVHVLARRLYPALGDLMTSLRTPFPPGRRRAASGERPHDSRPRMRPRPWRG